MNNEDLNKLTTNELDSLLLFALYKLSGNPNYSLISELAYLFDRQTLMKLLGYFGGTTIKIPTLKEFTLITEALILFEYVDIEGLDFDKGLRKLSKDNLTLNKAQVTKAYLAIHDVLKDYNLRKTVDEAD